MKVARIPVRATRLRRLLDRNLVPSRRLQSKVQRLIAGSAVMFSIAEVSDLRLAARQLDGRPLVTPNGRVT